MPPSMEVLEARHFVAQSCSATVISADSVLSFELACSPVGVHVKRTYRRSDGTKLHCSAVFHDEDSFVRWSEADDMRFAYALVFRQLRRTFPELIRAASGS